MSKNFTQILYSYISNTTDQTEKVVVEEWLSTMTNKQNNYNKEKVEKEIWADISAHIKLTLPQMDKLLYL